MSVAAGTLAEPESGVLFDAELVPHRSLSMSGFRILIGVVAAANLMIGLPLWLMGAWPVMGFMGIDVALLAWLFHKSYRSGRLRETLTLTDRELVVGRVSPEGKTRQWRLDAYWLRIEMDDPPRHESRLRLVSRGAWVVVGRFLVPHERLEVAHALRRALARLRERRFAHQWEQAQDSA
jgi:uncharacterized membrane protein